MIYYHFPRHRIVIHCWYHYFPRHKQKDETKFLLNPQKQKSTDKDTVEDSTIFVSLKLFVCYLLLKKSTCLEK